MQELNNKKDLLTTVIANEKLKIEAILDKIEEKPNIEAEIENLTCILREYEYKYKTLHKTLKYLEMSKEKLSSRYLGGLSKNFMKYVKMLKGELLENSDLDINLDVKIESNGEKKTSQYLSLGYQDLIGICIRFAMIDTVFSKEKAFIMLDDPFVNLDDEKLKEAINLVNMTSKDYQIIYFICHESRI